MDVGGILQHGSTGSCGQTGNAVWCGGHIDDCHVCFVVHDRISKSQSWYREEFGYAAQNNQVVIGIYQRDRSVTLIVLCKFNVHFVE